jgi:hypothetical protein
MQLPMRANEPVRLKRGRRWLTYGIGLGLWASGTIWLAFHYFLKTQTEFGRAENPLTHWWLALHGLFAFATLWLFGLLWGQHIIGAWKTRRHRVSGILLFTLLTVLIASGYLLYYAAGDKTRSIVSLIHWTLGLAAPIFFVLHRFMTALALRLRRRDPDHGNDKIKAERLA